MVMASQQPIYVDSDAPNDQGSGTITSPKKFLKGVVENLTSPGAVVLVKRDRFYKPDTNGYHVNISGKYDFTLGTYGEGPNPVIDSLHWELPGTPEAEGWNSVGDGLWMKMYPNGTYARRLAVGGFNNGNRIALRNPGKWMRRCKTLAGSSPALSVIKAAMGPDDIWFGPRDGPAANTSGAHYVFTGDDTPTGNPVTFYKGLCWNISNGLTLANGRVGIAGPAVQVQQSTNVLALGIDSWGSTSFGHLVTASGAVSTRNVVFKFCNSYYHYSGSHKAQALALSEGVVCSDILFEDCIGDSGTNIEEQEPTTAYGWLSGAMDMMTAYDNVKNVLFRRCTSVNSFHVAFCLGVYDRNSLKSDNCGFEDCYAYFAPWMTYSRGASTNRCMPNCFIRNCLFDGQNIRSQFNGSARVYGNTWINMSRSARYPSRSGWAYSSAELLDRSVTTVGNERYIYVVPEDVWVMHNTVVDPVGIPYVIETFLASDYTKTDVVNGGNMPWPVIAPNSVNIVNNALYDRKSKDYGVLDTVQVTARDVPIPVQNIKNNAIHGQGVTLKSPAMGYYNHSGLVSRMALNDAPDCQGANIFLDPKIDLTDPRNPKMAKDSPCRRAGRWTGKQTRDMKGRPFMIPPSIGPLEFTGGSFRS